MYVNMYVPETLHGVMMLVRWSCGDRSRLVGKIISRFEQRGYKLTALKLKQADEALLKTHYK